MRPAHIRVVDKIPLLPRFKPDIAALERLEGSVAATTDIRENSEASICAKPTDQRCGVTGLGTGAGAAVLRSQPALVSNGRRFSKKIRLWLEVEKALGIRLPFEAFNDRATLNEIAANVEKAMADLTPLRS